MHARPAGGLDRLLHLPADRLGVRAGGRGDETRVDSNAVDADGSVYRGYPLRPCITVHSPDGELMRTIDVPAGDADGLESATNFAIAPGTTDGYLTVSGADGGYDYTFDALAEGTRQSNGG